MGWRGTVRSLVAVARAAEREAQRRNKQEQNAQMIVDAADAVEDWQDHIGGLISIHTDMADAIDWHSIAKQAPPNQPLLHHINQDRAEVALTNFKPSFLHMFKGGSNKARQELEASVERAAALDEQQYRAELNAHIKIAAEWEEDTAFAQRLLLGKASAIKQVLSEVQTLANTALVGTAIEFSIDDNFLHARPQVHNDNIIPRFRRKQLASGRLSETKMPIGQFNELYQDYVASVCLKTAGDLFQILPLDEVYVTCMAEMLNTQTGHKEFTPILSVQFMRDTFMRLNLSSIDPSDSMRNFRHAMKFTKTKGFTAIEPLEPIAG